MIASLKADGKAGVVMPHGVLFRGGAEGKIRQGLLESDLFEAVIGLPSNLFYGTGIPASVLIFNRNKEEKRKGNVLFIAAEDNYQEGKNQNTLRDGDLAKITAAYETHEAIEKYARIVSLDEIKNNDYNLNITRYIDKSEEEEQVDIQAVIQEIQQIEAKHAATKAKLNDYLHELGVGGI